MPVRTQDYDDEDGDDDYERTLSTMRPARTDDGDSSSSESEGEGDDDDERREHTRDADDMPEPIRNPDAETMERLAAEAATNVLLGTGGGDAAAIEAEMRPAPFACPPLFPDGYIDDDPCFWCNSINAESLAKPLYASIVHCVRRLGDDEPFDMFVTRVHRVINFFRDEIRRVRSENAHAVRPTDVSPVPEWTLKSIHAHFSRHMPAKIHLAQDMIGQLYHQMAHLSRGSTRVAVMPNMPLPRTATTDISQRTVTEFSKCTLGLMKTITTYEAYIRQLRKDNEQDVRVPGENARGAGGDDDDAED